MAYDDPIEVATQSKRFYPIYDEAGDGNLQAVLDENGHLIARNLPGDPYGADALDIAGAAVDKVEVHASKEVGANHLQAVAAGFVAAQHQCRRFDCSLDDRYLAFVELKADDFPGLGFVSA